MARRPLVALSIIGAALASIGPISAQNQQGERPVFRSGVRATWLPGDRFWYRVTTPSGSEAILVDPVSAVEPSRVG